MEYTLCIPLSSGRVEFLGIGKIHQGKVLGFVAKYLPLGLAETAAAAADGGGVGAAPRGPAPATPPRKGRQESHQGGEEEEGDLCP